MSGDTNARITFAIAHISAVCFFVSTSPNPVHTCTHNLDGNDDGTLMAHTVRSENTV